MKSQVKQFARSLRQNLSKKGYQVPHSVMLHALAAASDNNNWHVLCAKSKTAAPDVQEQEDAQPRNLIGKAPLTRWQLQQIMDSEGHLEVVVAVALDTLNGDVEYLNDTVSELVTGCSYALCDIAYTTEPRIMVQPGLVALRVTAGDIEFEGFHHASPDEFVFCEFVSEWSEGGRVCTRAKVSLYDGRVTDIETSDQDVEGCCEAQYIEVADVRFDVEELDADFEIDAEQLDALRSAAQQ